MRTSLILTRDWACPVQLSMHGESEAIKEWRNRRTTGMSRLDALMADDLMEPAGMALVGMPEDEDGDAVLPFSASSARGGQNDDRAEEEITRQVACMQLPNGMEKHQKLAPLLDSLEPCLSGADSRLGLRQMHLAWTSNCTCAKSSVIQPCSHQYPLWTRLPQFPRFFVCAAAISSL